MVHTAWRRRKRVSESWRCHACFVAAGKWTLQAAWRRRKRVSKSWRCHACFAPLESGLSTRLGGGGNEYHFRAEALRFVSAVRRVSAPRLGGGGNEIVNGACSGMTAFQTATRNPFRLSHDRPEGCAPRIGRAVRLTAFTSVIYLSRPPLMQVMCQRCQRGFFNVVR